MTSEAAACLLRAIAAQLKTQSDMPVAELSNPGPVGKDTGYEFKDPKTGEQIHVIAEVGQTRDEAITETRENHGLPG
jgi:hypothetical protein